MTLLHATECHKCKTQGCEFNVGFLCPVVAGGRGGATATFTTWKGRLVNPGGTPRLVNPGEAASASHGTGEFGCVQCLCPDGAGGRPCPQAHYRTQATSTLEFTTSKSELVNGQIFTILQGNTQFTRLKGRLVNRMATRNSPD